MLKKTIGERDKGCKLLLREKRVVEIRRELRYRYTRNHLSTTLCRSSRAAFSKYTVDGAECPSARPMIKDKTIRH